MSACGSGMAAADIGQMEAGIFDPWINCDDLDLGAILHQASSSGSSSTSSSSPLSTQTIHSSLSAASSPLAGAQVAALLAADGPHGSGSEQPADANYSHTQSHHLGQLSLDQQQGQHQNQQQNQHQLHLQLQHNLHHQQLTPPPNSPASKQNIFNIITANAISTQNANNRHSAQSFAGAAQNQAQGSLSSSQCSSASSALSSLDSPPADSHPAYLSSPSSSSPILIPPPPPPQPPQLVLDSKSHLHHVASGHLRSGQAAEQQPVQLAYGRFAERAQTRDSQTNDGRSLQANQTNQPGQNPFAIQDQADHEAAIVAKNQLENLLHLASGNNCDTSNASLYETNRLDHFASLANNYPLVAASSQVSNLVGSSQKSTPTTNSLPNIASSGQSNSFSSSSSSSSSSSAAKNKSSNYTAGINSHSNNKSASLFNTNGQQAAGQKVRRCRHITDYVLADEEKRLLIKEGYADFPMTCQSRPLSKNEERILRKIRRKIRNKKSAQCSRQRKKEYVEDLERKYASVLRENEQLKQVLDRLQQQDQQHQQLHQFHQHDGGSMALDLKDLFVSSNKTAQSGQPMTNVYN